MRKILYILLFTAAALYGEVIHQYPTKALLESDIKIIDIRTEAEWRYTGIIKGSIPLTFFDEKGQYNIPLFMQELQKHIKPGEQFALICHTGSRTLILADFLDKNFHMNVINLRGGIAYAQAKGIKTVQYLKK